MDPRMTSLMRPKHALIQYHSSLTLFYTSNITVEP